LSVPRRALSLTQGRKVTIFFLPTSVNGAALEKHSALLGPVSER
jgi:hypothetical protein